MSEKIAVNLGTKPKEKETFEFTKDIDGVRKTVRGRQVENGWVISISKEWVEKGTGDGDSMGEWKHNEWEYITKSNPLEKLRDSDGETNEEDDVMNLVNDVASSGGMLLVD